MVWTSTSCKHYTSKYRKSLRKLLSENNGYDISALRTSVRRTKNPKQMIHEVLRNGTEENKKFVQYTKHLFSIPNYYIKKGRPHGHLYGKKPGTTSTTSRIRSRRNARSSTWVSTTGSSVMRDPARTCLTPVARRKYVARWTNWRPHAPPNSRRNSSV